MRQETIPLRKRLTSKFAALILLLFMVPLIFLFFYASNTASDVLIASLRDDLKEKAFLVGADIDRFYSQRERDVRILSQADVLESDEIDGIIKYLTEIIDETPYLDDIDVINLDGFVIASSGVQNEKGVHILTMHPSLQALFGNVLKAKQGDVFVSGILELDSGPGLAFLTPITDDTNTIVVKVLLVEINLDVVKRIVTDFDERVIGDKFVYLVDNDGRVIVSADPDVSLLSPYPDLTVQPELLANFALQGDVGSIIYEDTRNDLVMAGFADMGEFGVNKAMDWSIIAVAPIAYITKPVEGFRNALLIFTVIVFSVSLLLVWWVGRLVVRPILRVRDSVQRYGAGDYTARSDVKTLDEAGQLANAFNTMAGSLETEITQRKGAKEALRQARDQLERRVQERTRELADANTALRTEITERKRAKEELIVSQRQLSAVLIRLARASSPLIQPALL